MKEAILFRVWVTLVTERLVRRKITISPTSSEQFLVIISWCVDYAADERGSHAYSLLTKKNIYRVCSLYMVVDRHPTAYLSYV